MREVPGKRAGQILGESYFRMWRMHFAQVKAAYAQHALLRRRETKLPCHWPTGSGKEPKSIFAGNLIKITNTGVQMLVLV